MKKLILLPLAILLCQIGRGTNSVSTGYHNEEMQRICDSIAEEGYLMYLYETAAWGGTDIVRERPEVLREVANYTTYHEGDTIKVFYTDKENQCISEMFFLAEEKTPRRIVWGTRPLTDLENKMLSAKTKILQNIYKGGFKIKNYSGFNYNTIFMTMGTGYRLYLLPGAMMHGVIPFGNDWVFFADESGNITYWHKMHENLIPIRTTIDGKSIRGPHEPFITPTDVCTFLLYGPMNGIEYFSVYSTSIKKYITYDWGTRSVVISDDPPGLGNKSEE